MASLAASADPQQLTLKLPLRTRIETASTAVPTPTVKQDSQPCTLYSPRSPSPCPHVIDLLPLTPRTPANNGTYWSAPLGPRTCGRRQNLSPLLKALSSGSARAVRDVLDMDPAAATDPLIEFMCEPPLCAAIRLGCDAEVAALLLDRGADVHAVDRDGRTPLLVLCAQPRSETWNMDLAFPRDPLYKAALDSLDQGADKLAEVLIGAGSDVMHRDELGLSAACLARKTGNEHVVRLLVEHGALDVGQFAEGNNTDISMNKTPAFSDGPSPLLSLTMAMPQLPPPADPLSWAECLMLAGPPPDIDHLY